jgi:putative endonuclease
MYYVYLLQSEKDMEYYVGQTNDIKKRLSEHNAGLVRATKHRRPLRLIGYEAYDSRNEARWREHQLKQHGDKKEKFIKDLTASSRTSSPKKKGILASGS